jgi:arginase family enzyme
MSILVLDLDGAFDPQPELVSVAGRVDARDLGPALRLWSRPAALDALEARIRDAAHGKGAALVFAGSGDFHHMSALLVRRAAEMAPERGMTVLHVDNHPDWVRFSPGMHCGSWAAKVARFSGVRQVISVAMCSPDMEASARKGADLSVVREGLLTPFPLRAGAKEECVVAGRRFPTIETLGDALFLELVDRMIGTDDLYITIDKDVLSPLDAVTNWDQGDLRLHRLVHWLQILLDGRRLRGADIVGDASTPVYGPGPVSAILKRVEAAMDQPWHVKLDSEAIRINAAANLTLRDCLLPHIKRAA